MQCNKSLTTAHDNICVIVKESVPQRYKLNHDEILAGLVTMKCRNMTKCWTCLTGKSSIVVIESEYDPDLWIQVWRLVKKLYDSDNPKHPKTIIENKKIYAPLLDGYLETNTKIIGELPKLEGTIGRLLEGQKFSAYAKINPPIRTGDSIILQSNFQDTCYNMAEIIEEGINFLRVEASEILAFVATDCHRICKPGIPPHLPIAYGLRGSSMPMSVMRNIVNDIRNELKTLATTVLCEVYDGQFHSIIVRSEIGEPLTRLQHTWSNFKNMMTNFDRYDLVENLLLYSQISEDDKTELSQMKFHNGSTKDLDNVRISMKRVLRTSGRRKTIIRKIFVETIPMEKYQMKHIVTYHRDDIWRRYQNKFTQLNRYEGPNVLTPREIGQIIEGTKVHRRITRHQILEDNNSESSDNDSDDPDYNPDVESVISDNESDIDLDESSMENVTNLSTASTGGGCIKKILSELKKLNNKHNWNNENIDTFIRKYMSSKRAIEKLFKYEMDVINNEVKATFGKTLFNKGDSKQVRTNKIYHQLKQMPQLLQFESSDEEELQLYQPKKLFDIYRSYVTSGKYPKEYLAAPLCRISHMSSVKEWEEKSPIPIEIDLPFINDKHIIFNYPEFSLERNQMEMRTFDYTHILNNLRYHICNRGFTGVSTQAFINVSKSNHDVLPRAIVEDKMDRQNSTISQRFFSEDVEKILLENGDFSEAEFCQKTRNWFRACDERGMRVEQRLYFLNDMYQFLLSKCNISDYPPITTHVEGIPIRTYEAILHTISTRFSLFSMSSTQSYNTRAISTLAVESFFSDLTRYEFSGLGAAKAVDIPKLISHVVHVNTTKHNPSRGFEFTTSTRDNYPTYLMDEDIENTGESLFSPCAFDLRVDKKKKIKKRWFTIAKPKQVTKGAKGVRQYFKIDESKLSLEKRLGDQVNLDNCNV